MFSLVLDTCKNIVDTYMETFKPLIEKFNAEVVVISDGEIESALEQEYPVYEYFGDYSNLEEYCFSLCRNDHIIIIRNGWKLEQKFVENLGESLLILDKNTFITCKCRIYYSPDKFAEIKVPLVFNKKNTEAVEKSIDCVIEDYGLLESCIENIEKNLWKLIKYKAYDIVYNWWRYISEEDKDGNLRLKFLEALEKIKLKLNLEEQYKIEDLFRNEEFGEYKKYLNTKRLYLEKKEGYRDLVKNNIKKLNVSSKNTFLTYFIPLFMEDGDLLIYFLETIGMDLTKTYISYFLSSHENFYDKLYNFLISIDLPKEIKMKNNKRVYLFKEITRTYITEMSAKADDIEKKQKLVQVFVDYTNYAIYTVNDRMRKNANIFIDQETKFIIEIDKAIGKLNQGNIEDAIDLLLNAAKIYPAMEKAIMYYIQKLRIENQVKPYKLSICMIVKDEEKNLDRCLSSLKPLVDSGLAELIIVDTGSKDDTISIAKKYTDKVFLHPWQGSFSEARNYSISLAQGEYIFIIDADEELEPEGVNELIETFNSDGYWKYSTYTLKVKNFSNVELTKYSINTQALIFKNDGTFYYEGSVHNQPMYKLPIKHLDAVVLHYGYIMADEEVREKKFKRTATLLKKELAKDPHNIYYRFQLSVSYGMYGDEKEALRHVQQYMEILENKEVVTPRELMYYAHAARVYLRNLMYDDALRICDKALKIQPDYIDLVFYKAAVLFKKEEYEPAIKYLKNYLDLYDDFLQRDIAGNDSLVFYTLDSRNEALKMLLISYYRLKKYTECIELGLSVIDYQLLPEIATIMIECAFESERYKELADIYKNIVLTFNERELRDSFVYLMQEIFKKFTPEKVRKCLEAFRNLDIEDDFIDLLKVNDILNTGNSEDLDAYFIGIDKIDKNILIDVEMLKKYKNALKFTLINPFIVDSLPDERILSLLDTYLGTLCQLVANNREDLLSQKELLFLNSILDALDELSKKNPGNALKYIKLAASSYEEIAKPLNIFVANMFRT
ncbi:glycosyltransferase family 2 protein [Thermosediminibacter oceani]|uniref:Glycosyl transferase family 2 n=1 Tax=Thermosediminibacter oceani (strain ATCC BAA-1034 / DSM 16646 / JW/IW-1228P) TaxID=555079 RepID=D9RYA3_THEOJ|nr:glycosyltransferase family 2 protein [Thermosediminibacter oceani]ADL08327.1 glycosyl transferase family 2 [Thermosediminibacter oceani DSM 16646]